MRNSADEIDEIKEIKNISGRRSIRGAEGDNFIFEEALVSRKKAINNNEDRSISEPPQLRYNNHHIGTDSVRLKTIREKMDDNQQCSSDDDENYSKTNSQLNGSDLDLEIPESASQTPTPTPLMVVGATRRINSETNLNDSKRRLTGFMGNRSKRFCASTSELSFSSHLDTNKSLFSPKNNRGGSRSGSLYGSNMSLNSSSNNSRLFMVNSPFYNGKTTFGGASAYPRKDINHHKILRNPIQMRPSSSLSNSSNTSTKSEGYMPESNAAKRILEIMTQFNGPLKETRSMGNNINSMIKIPGLVQNQKRFGEEELQLNRSIALSRPSAPYSRPIAGAATAAQKNTPESIAASLLNTSSSSPQVPTMSQLLKMKRLQNNTERAREIANRSENFLNQQLHEYKLPSSNDNLENRRGEGSTPLENSNHMSSSSSSLKMKNNITKNLLRNDKIVIDQPPEPLNLPNIQLPELKSYPKFDIKLPTSVVTSENSSSSSRPVSYANCFKTNSNTIASSPPPPPTITTSFKTGARIVASNEISSEKTSSLRPATTTAVTIVKSNNDNFKFSMPIKFDAAGEMNSSKASTADKFIFSKPLAIDEKENVNTNVSSVDTTKSQPQQAATDNLFKNLVAKQNSQWECNSCLTRNENEKTKCLCCDTVRPGSETISKPSESSKSVTSTTSMPSDDLFKKLAAQQKKSQWECDACMTKNDLDKEKCMCCETPKPGSKPTPPSSNSSSSLLLSTPSSGGFKFGMPSTTSPTVAAAPVTSEPIKPSDDLFKSLAAQQKKSQWECDACMTRNESDKDKCVCCETPKPGSNPAATKPQTSSSSFSFGIKPAIETSAKFSFGMPAAVTSSPKSSSSTDVGFKKIVDKQNSNWECSACMTRNEQSQTKCICCEQVKPGSSENQATFSFASKSISLPPPTEVKFSFGMQPTDASKTTTDKEIEPKKDEVDKPVSTGFSFGSSSSATATTGFKFGASETKPASSEVTATASFTFKAPASNAISSSFTIPSPKAETKNESTDNKEEADKQLKSCLGSTDVKSADKKVSFNIKTTTSDKATTTTDRPGGFYFPKAEGATSASPVAFVSANKTASSTNGGISFSAFSKPSEETKSESSEAPKTSEGIQFSSSSTGNAAGFSFGAKSIIVSTAAESTPATQSGGIFSFGGQKTEGSEPQKTFGSFGNTALSSTATISTPAAAAPVFGSPSSFVFGNAKKDENTAPSQPSAGFSFSSKPANSNMVFGSSQNAAPSITPVFGSTNSMPTFGSNISNSATPNNNNNESTFGSKMNSFGSIQAAANSPQKRSFDFGSGVNSSEGTQNKKFDFGSVQQPQTNSTPFAFSAQPEVKPSFNFTPTAPAFSFTANNTTNNNPNVGNSQENLFQFGANTSSATTATQGIFAFGANAQQQPQQQPQQPATAPPIMSFGATAPSVAIGGLNAAFNPGTGGASPQRKILRANRRNNIRR